MSGRGLEEVKNPSALFLTDRENTAPGAAVFAGIEGTRPVLVEFQALVAPSPLANHDALLLDGTADVYQ